MEVHSGDSILKLSNKIRRDCIISEFYFTIFLQLKWQQNRKPNERQRNKKTLKIYRR